MNIPVGTTIATHTHAAAGTYNAVFQAIDADNVSGTSVIVPFTITYFTLGDNATIDEGGTSSPRSYYYDKANASVLSVNYGDGSRQ